MITIVSTRECFLHGDRIYEVKLDKEKTTYSIFVSSMESFNLSEKQIESLVESRALRLKSMFEKKE
jgi:hypothetical protein